MEEEKQVKTSTFKEKVKHEKENFWGMEAEKVVEESTDDVDKPQNSSHKSKKKSSNAILFTITLLVSIAIFAFIFFALMG